jgi:hypothetical protein
MAKHGGRYDHFGVITALEDFQVRATSERRFDANANLARFQGLGRDLLDPDIFFAI